MLVPRSLSRVHRILHRRRRLIFLLVTAYLVEILLHQRQFRVPRPAAALDPPFNAGCLDAYASARDAPRENAAIVMLARNEDIDGAVTAVRSLEKQFNRLFNYPLLFLNDQEWSEEFVYALSREVSGDVKFETIGSDMWGWPKWMDDEDKRKARQSMRDMERRKMPYAGSESYHHMCRFESGFFFDHPALQSYDWYWRIEPDVTFTCAITYDPFLMMAATNKTYGYTMALWEVGSTSPTLFRTVSDYKASNRIPTTPLWTAMMDPTWAPFPIRNYVFPHLPLALHSRDAAGDSWNFCHFWSNFEIANLNFFRSQEYRDFFDFLDLSGGFYHERWGDAPVHSLALALFTQPENLHYFEDIGYRHPPFQHCPGNTPQGTGCRCDCDPREGRIPPVCLNRLRETVAPA